jgi:homopolymeric O-antigen transport system permease protein
VRELIRYRDLVWTLVARDLKVRYRRSTLGFLWTMLQPLLTMVVFTTVFSHVFRFDLPRYPVYALSGILFWNFFSQTITTSMNSLRYNANLLTKVPVPKVIFPLATLLSGIVNLLFATVPLLAILLATGQRLSLALLFLPVAILVAALFTLGVGLFLSPLAVIFTDLVEMVGVVLMMTMYMTPIFYPAGIVPERYQAIFRLNPIRAVLEIFRGPIYRGELPSAAELGLAVAIAAVSLAVGALAFRRNSGRIVLYL